MPPARQKSLKTHAQIPNTGPVVRPFLDALTRYQMVSPGDRVLVALSGGADSVALLHLFLSVRRKLDISVAACHVNHGLRGRESGRDEKFVSDLCAARGVPLSVRRIDPAAYARRERVSVEMASRTLRYEALEKAGAELSCSRIATAHHLDDLAETVLLRVLKGTGLSAMAAVPLDRGAVIRPLLFCGKSDLEKYLKRLGCGWVTDRSNRKSDPERNFLRLKVLPLLNRRFPAFRKKLAELYETAREEERFWDSQTGLLKKFVTGDSRGVVIDKSVFRSGVSRAVLRRFFRDLLMENGLGRVSSLSGLVDRLIGEGRRSHGNRTLFSSRSVRILSSYDRILVGGKGQNFPKGTKYAKLSDGCAVSHNGRVLRFERISQALAAELTGRTDDGQAVFCSGQLATVSVRSRENGDFLRIRGGRKKKIKDLFMDRKIPVPEREAAVVLAAEGREAVAVYVPGAGFRVSEAFYVRPGAGPCWRVTVSGENRRD